MLRPSSDSLSDDTVVEESASFFSYSFRVSSSEKVSSSFFFDREELNRSRASWADWRIGVLRRDVVYGGDSVSTTTISDP